MIFGVLKWRYFKNLADIFNYLIHRPNNTVQFLLIITQLLLYQISIALWNGKRKWNNSK